MHIYIYIYIIEWKMVEVLKIYIYKMIFNNTLNFKARGFQFAQLVKSLIWLYKRFGVQSPPTPKTDWRLDLMIKNYYQEWTP